MWVSHEWDTKSINEWGSPIRDLRGIYLGRLNNNNNTLLYSIIHTLKIQKKLCWLLRGTFSFKQTKGVSTKYKHIIQISEKLNYGTNTIWQETGSYDSLLLLRLGNLKINVYVVNIY